ncbi:MAG: nucleotidyltransferase family protein, partial [Oligoflexia bacterium]|nr:nucleotidyltransferase family protein [Oligoflexia bacterium]
MRVESDSATIVGRSMEPSICEGDLVEIQPVKSKDLIAGNVYCFAFGTLNRRVAHRLVQKSDFLVFQGDRQPIQEEVSHKGDFFRIIRVLDRRVAPDPEFVLFGVILLSYRENIFLSKNSMLKWPWDRVIYLAQKHRLISHLCYGLKKLNLWNFLEPEVMGLLENSMVEYLIRSEMIDDTMLEVKKLIPEGILFKGAMLRDLYPEKSLRLMEDIDIYVGEDFSQSVENLLKNDFVWDNEAEKISRFYHSANLKFIKTGISVDLHKTLFQKNRFCFPKKIKKEDFTPEFLFVYLSAHCFLHWGRHGQSLLDLYKLLEKEKINFALAFEVAKEYRALSSFLFACHQLQYWFNVITPEFIQKQIPIGI